MNRLTKRYDDGSYEFNYLDPASYMQKLSQLEDIEEELGIDLITLFIALKNGFYTTFYNKNKYDNSCYYDISLEFKCIYVNDYDAHFSLDFKDYGKTWALTKEEIKYV